jgi:hypothetical protein
MLNNIIGSLGLPKTIPVLPITANLTGQWDASNASSVTLSSGKVSQLNDLSGNGRNMLQATSADQPTYTTAGKNGLNTMTFSGAQYMTPSATWSQTFATIFIVVKFDDTSGKISNGWTNYQLDLTTNFGFNNWDWQLEAGGGGTAVHFDDGASNTNWNYFSLKRPNSGSTATAKVNGGGTWAVRGVPGALTALSTGKLWIGTRNDLAVPMTGQIGEVLLYSTLMSDTDIATINAYLAAKWAI